MNPFGTIQKLSEEDIRKLDQSFNDYLSYQEKREKLWGMLYPQMKALSFDELFFYRTSYTKWFSQLAWRLFRQLSHEEMFDILKKVSGIGFIQGEDVWMHMIDYLNIRSIDEENMQIMYERMKNAFMTSREILYKDEKNGADYRILDFVRDMNTVDSRSDSLMGAELFTKINKNIKKRKEEEGYITELEDIIAYMKSMVNFFVGVEKENIYTMIESIFYPQKYENLEQQNISREQNTSTDMAFKELKPVGELQKVSVDFKKIKKELEDTYGYDQDGNLNSIGAVMQKLLELSQKYEDTKIEELYYFDEAMGKFVWNEDLFGSL